MRNLPLLMAGIMMLGGCELDEVVTANSEDVVIAEIYLRAGASVQTALLHRTRQPFDSARAVPNARIEVTDDANNVMPYFPAPDTMCVPPQAHRIVGSCYVSESQRFDVIPGERYSVRITLAEGGEITGTTTVPRTFELLRPAIPNCELAPFTRLEIAWSASPDAWVYASETAIRGLRPFLEQRGIPTPQDSIELFGLSISSVDTTISFPNEFGLFERFDTDLTEALVVLQLGLPAGAEADIDIAAADRNYVNWERGGNFNPSGVVRIGNLRGRGAGVFGSLVIKHFHVRVTSDIRVAC